MAPFFYQNVFCSKAKNYWMISFSYNYDLSRQNYFQYHKQNVSCQNINQLYCMRQTYLVIFGNDAFLCLVNEEGQVWSYHWLMKWNMPITIEWRWPNSQPSAGNETWPNMWFIWCHLVQRHCLIRKWDVLKIGIFVYANHFEYLPQILHLIEVDCLELTTGDIILKLWTH